jgi:DNA-directed RNA polymerase subunit M/transcription elongation factor TFIIS
MTKGSNSVGQIDPLRRQIGGKLKVVSVKIYDAFLEKQRIRAVLNVAQKKGLIFVPENCSVCGKKPNYFLLKHHENYDKPWDILWVCSRCHSKYHRYYTSKGKRRTPKNFFLGVAPPLSPDSLKECHERGIMIDEFCNPIKDNEFF